MASHCFLAHHPITKLRYGDGKMRYWHSTTTNLPYGVSHSNEILCHLTNSSENNDQKTNIYTCQKLVSRGNNEISLFIFLAIISFRVSYFFPVFERIQWRVVGLIFSSVSLSSCDLHRCPWVARVGSDFPEPFHLQKYLCLWISPI